MAEKPEKRYIEVAGDWELSDRDLASKIRQSFLNVATAEENRGKIWITRSAGLGKVDEKTKIKGQWTAGSKSLQWTGGRKTWDDYLEADKEIRKKYHQWKNKGKIGKAPPKSIKETEKTHLLKPRTSVGSIVVHAAREYNKNLRHKALQEKMPEKAIHDLLDKKGIHILPVTQEKFSQQGVAWQESVDRREAYIQGIGAKQKAFFTRSGTLESKPEQMAREMFERVAQYVKERGIRTKTAPTKVRDFFIDAVNAKKFKNKEMEKEFKAGARQFLINKELDIHYKGDSSKPYLTEDAWESIKGWHPGSVLTDLSSANYGKPQYEQISGQTETTYVGSKTITGETIGEGPDLPENVKLASTSLSRDHGVNVDRMTERYGSSHFAQMTDDEGKIIQKFENPRVETPVTSWMDELGSEHEGTIKETKVLTTKPQWVTSITEDIWSDVSDYNPPMSAFPGQGKGGKIAHTWLKEGQVYWSEQVDTGVTPSEWVNTLDVAETPKTALTTNLRAAQQHAYGTTTKHTSVKDAVKEYLNPPAEFDAQTGEFVTGIAPDVDTAAHLDRTNLLMQQDMENIEAKYGRKEPGTLLTAFDAGKYGQTVDPDQSKIKPVSEIRTQVMEDAGTTSVTAIPGEKQKDLKPTHAQLIGMSKRKEFALSEPEKYKAYIEQKIKEYKDRGEKPYVKPPPERGATIAHLGKGQKVSTPTADFLEFMGNRETQTADEAMANYLGDPPIDDFPENVYEQGSQMSANELLMDDQIEDLKARNALSQGIKVISGGQIGADKIGLEEARKLGYETGGTAPQGFKTSRGVDASLSEFGLSEITTDQINAYTGPEKFYGPRTEQNVLNSDVTLLFTNKGEQNSPGSKLTRNLAAKHKKPLLENPSIEQIKEFKTKFPNIKTVNIAGNRKFSDRAAIKNALLYMEGKPVIKKDVQNPRTKIANLLINSPDSVMPKDYGKFFRRQAEAIDQREAAAEKWFTDTGTERRRRQMTAVDDQKTYIAIAEAEKAALNRPTRQELIDSGEVPPDYFDEKYMGKNERGQTEIQRHDQSRALEKWRYETGLTDWRGNVIKGTDFGTKKPPEKPPERKIPQFKPGDVLTYGIGGKTQSFDIVVSKGENIHGINVVYSKDPDTKRWKSSEVSTGRYLFQGGTRKEVMAATQKYFGDPKNAEKALTVIKDVRKKNVTTGAGPSPETIELFKSRVTGEYMTKGKVKKTAVKQLGKNVGKTIRGPVGGSTLGIFSMLLAPIGAAGDVIRHERAIREEKAMKHPPYRRKKSGWSMLVDAKDGTYGSALLNRMAPEEMGGPFPSLANQRNKYKSYLWQ